MTSRSFDSHKSAATRLQERRSRVTEADLYNYVLRVGYLTYLLTPKPSREPITPSIPTPRQDRNSRDYSSTLSSISSSISSFADVIREVSGRDSSKQIKFPERLVDNLDIKLRAVAMGKDPNYTDQLTRRIIALFWSSFKEPNFQKQIKRNRKIEELILHFVTQASGALRKDPQLSQGDAWKVELNTQIGHFVSLLRDTVRITSHVPPELVSRLDIYASKLVPSHNPSSAASHRPTTSVENPFLTQPDQLRLSDMPVVQIIGRLFDKADEELLRDIKALQRICTEKAALQDLKTSLKNIHANMPFPGRREDFSDDLAYQQWKATEQSHLSQLMVLIVRFNPEVAKPLPSLQAPSHQTRERGGSVGSRNSLYNQDLPEPPSYSDEEHTLGHSFTYIPPDPKKFYKKLIEKCVDVDLKAMHNLPEDQEVSLGILSPRHLDVINECALRWRIMQSYRVSCFLDVVKYKYEREEVPLECLPEALGLVEKAIAEQGIENWTIADRDYISSVYSAVFNVFLSQLYQALDQLPNLSKRSITPTLEILGRLEASRLLERYQEDYDARFRELSDRIRVLAAHHYADLGSEFLSQADPHAALPFLLMSDSLESLAKRLDKAYKEPILGRLDIVALFVETQIPLYFTDLDSAADEIREASKAQPEPPVPLEDIFKLYQRIRALLNMLHAFSPNVNFDPVSFFEPYVKTWLHGTENKTGHWVQNAISVDKFVPEGPGRHSTSIIDLFDSLNSPVTFILELEWPDKVSEALFMTELSKIVSKSIEEYCRKIEELFMNEMFPRAAQPYLQPQKQSAWLEKAKGAVQGEKKIIPFNFTAESCVKLNNIEWARALLDKLYKRLDADKVSALLHEKPLPNPEAGQGNLFTVKVVMAENLVAREGDSLDTYVTLSDPEGNRLAKTRTIYESPDPRWEETFDLSVRNDLWLMASVRDRHLIGKADIVGRAYLHLDPRKYGDYLSHDEWYNLDPHGRLLVRISMEGERDDILFYFGRAFRSLKRAEGDMVRVFVDKMGPLFRSVLSRTILKRLVKTGIAGLDYNRTLSTVTGLLSSLPLGSSSQSEVHIPSPQSEKPRLRPNGGVPDEEIEAALGPLFDYLNDNLQILNSALSENAKDIVMTRIWKELLAILENLLVPPLSNVPTSQKVLSDKEVDIVFKWMRSLLTFFHADGEGLSLESLQNAKYREVMSIRFYYDWDTDRLMEEAVRMMQTHLRSAPTMKKRAKTVLSQRSLGTIKLRKKDKRQEAGADNSFETVLRILRMRPHTSDFLTQQLDIVTQLRSQAGKRRQDSL